MRLGRFFWKLCLGNVALLALMMGAGVWLAVAELDRFHSEELTPYLRSQAALLRAYWDDELSRMDAPRLDELAKQIAEMDSGGVRVTVIATDGRVLADSAADPSSLSSYAERPEFIEALAGGEGQSTRESRSIGLTIKYLAVRVGPEDSPLGVLRLATPILPMTGRAAFIRTLLWPVGFVAILAAVGLAVGLAMLWSGHVRRLTRTAQRLARGDLATPVDDSGSDEVAAMARSLNRMRDRLSQQLHMIDRQREVLESLLSRLNEGVIVARANGRIVLLNAEASRLLNVPELHWGDADQQRRLTVEECVPQHDLQRLLLPNGLESSNRDSYEANSQLAADTGEAGLKRAMPAGESSEARLDMQGPKGPISVLARASDISLPESAPGGRVPSLAIRPGQTATLDAPRFGQTPVVGPSRRHPAVPSGMERARLLVLTDVTDMTRAMKMRSDFVANASHELRTPLSAVRGAVQTLLTMDLAAEAPAAARFLKMIERHSSRLEALVSDLLELSRLEAPSKKFTSTTILLGRLCDDLQGRWADAIAARGLQWELDLDPQASKITANAHLLHVVLDNLVENAIKFTEPGGRVRVIVRRAGADGASSPPPMGTVHSRATQSNTSRMTQSPTGEGGVSITIADTGCGIPRVDQERVFERFYQVTASRSPLESPEKRGTGLGLSIVRHAVAAMGGSVGLQSEVGRGTQVTVTLPGTPVDAPS